MHLKLVYIKCTNQLRKIYHLHPSDEQSSLHFYVQLETVPQHPWEINNAIHCILYTSVLNDMNIGACSYIQKLAIRLMP